MQGIKVKGLILIQLLNLDVQSSNDTGRWYFTILSMKKFGGI